MQLNRLQNVNVYTYTTAQGTHGVIKTPSVARTIEAIVSPVEDKLSVEIYGNKITQMLQIITSDTIADGEMVSISGSTPTHKIVSVKEYAKHKTALAEKI